MELFQEDESCLRSRCTVTGGSYDLTAQFRTHVTGGKMPGMLVRISVSVTMKPWAQRSSAAGRYAVAGSKPT